MGGRGVFGVIISVTGRESRSTYTDADGRYSVTVTGHGDYTVTPVSFQNPSRNIPKKPGAIRSAAR